MTTFKQMSRKVKLTGERSIQSKLNHLAGKTIVGPVDVVLKAMFGLQQQDSHVMLWRFITFHYGNVANWKQVRGK